MKPSPFYSTHDIEIIIFTLNALISELKLETKKYEHFSETRRVRFCSTGALLCLESPVLQKFNVKYFTHALLFSVLFHYGK